jgi:D-mannonate dehydratase
MINTMVMPLTAEDSKKKIPVLWTYDIVERAKIRDRCGFEVAEVESRFVANEIVGILNNYNETTKLFKEAIETMKSLGVDVTKFEKHYQVLKSVYEAPDPYPMFG